MSNNNYDEYDDDFDDIEGTTDASDLVKKLRKADRAKDKIIKELRERVESFDKVEKERTVKSVLEKKGVNPKAVRLILKDIEDINETSVNEWLEDNADLFGIKIDEDAPKVNEMDRAALRQQDIITQGAITPDRAEDLELRMENAQSEEEFIAILRSQSQFPTSHLEVTNNG